MTLRVLIADDEQPLREYLINLLNTLWPEINEIIEAENGIEALKSIIKNQPTVAFLDINMPGMTGLQVAEQCKNECHIVFVTAYDQYAIEAFENSAIDYLLKPATESRLQATIQRLKQRLEQPPISLEKTLNTLNANQYLSWLKVAHKEEIQLIKTADVDYFQSSDKYTSAFVQGKEYILRTSLKKLEQQLDSNQFWRIHRSTIVRVNAIEQINKMLSGQLVINILKHQLPVSRAYQRLFKQD